MSAISSSRKASFIILTIIHIAAALLGYATYRLAGLRICNLFWKLFVADVVATIFVWAFGMFYKNVSVYDPYWSVLPPVMLTALVVHCAPIGLPGILLLIAVWYWGIRLTGNWAFTFRNLDTEDWRYTKYRTEHKPFVFQIINFFGLNMMPTIVVFAALLPGLDLMSSIETVQCSVETVQCSVETVQCSVETVQCSVSTVWVGFAVCIAAATIQLIADTQRHRFSRAHKGQVCNVGLWKHGRHPNYFGEISMWWGVWIMFASVNDLSNHLWYLVGPVAMTCLFLFISIPLMEKRQLQNKPAYAEYKKKTRILI